MTHLVEADGNFDFRCDAYRSIFEQSECSAFCSPLWLDNFYRHLVPATGAEPLIVRVYRNGSLVAVMPLVRRRYLSFRVIEFADLGVSDYSDFPKTEDFSPPAALADQIRSTLSPYDFIAIRKIRHFDLDKFSILGRCTTTLSPFRSHATALAGPMSQWREQNYESSFKNFLERKTRLLQRLGDITLHAARNEHEINAAFDALKRFRAKRFDALGFPDPLQRPDIFEFYRLVGIEGAAKRAAATYTLSLNGDTIAVIFGLVHQRVFSFLLMGFDFERYRNYSLGLLTIEQTIADRIAEGDGSFDFMIGEQPYKKDFGTAATKIYSIWSGNGLLRTAAIRAVAHSRLLQRIARRLSRT